MNMRWQYWAGPRAFIDNAETHLESFRIGRLVNCKSYSVTLRLFSLRSWRLLEQMCPSTVTEADPNKKMTDRATFMRLARTPVEIPNTLFRQDEFWLFGVRLDLLV